MMLKKVFLLPCAVLLILSCGTDNDDTVVGADFILDREWAEPVEASFQAITGDTWFEAIVRGGQQEEVLVGENRKFVFSSAVRWDDYPADPDSFISASLLIKPTVAEGISDLFIERVAEDWTEGVSVDSMATFSDGFAIPLPVDEIVPIDVGWAKAWADSDAVNLGVYLTMVDPDQGFLRIPAHEDPDSTADLLRLRLVYRDSAGVDSADIDPIADRFDGLKQDVPDYSLENEPSDTLLVGMRGSLTNQSMFQITVPEVIRNATVNRAEMELFLAGARLDDSVSLNLEIHVIIDDDSDTTECPGTILCDRVVFESLISATGYVTGDDPGQSVLIDVTALVRSWVLDGEYTPRILLRATENNTRRRYLSFHSVDSAVDSLKPRLNILYTPPRPGLEEVN